MTISNLLLEVTIITLSATGSFGGLECKKDMLGGYVDKTNKIVICQNDSTNFATSSGFILYHELGHHFWFDHMTEKERKSYERLWNSHKKKKAFLRNYSKKTVEEGFADDFGMLVLNADFFSKENRIRKKYIERILKNK